MHNHIKYYIKTEIALHFMNYLLIMTFIFQYFHKKNRHKSTATFHSMAVRWAAIVYYSRAATLSRMLPSSRKGFEIINEKQRLSLFYGRHQLPPENKNCEWVESIAVIWILRKYWICFCLNAFKMATKLYFCMYIGID